MVSGFKPDLSVLSHLDAIIEECKKQNIGVIIVKSPHFMNNIDFNDWLVKYGEENNVPVLMESNSLFWRNHPELFYDGSHLNSQGADSLSTRVCKFIIDHGF